MKVAVFAPLFPPAINGGGPIRTIDALVAAAPGGDSISVVTSNRDLGASQDLDVPSDVWVPRARARVRYVTAGRLTALLAALRSLGRPDLVYCNGYFAARFSIVPRVWARVTRVPTLIAPRGEFSEAALAIKASKKRAFLSVMRRLDAQAIWHASTSREADDIRKVMGERTRVVVRENESLLPRLAERPRAVGGVPRLVFISRLVPNKGLHIVLEALSTIDRPWLLDIYGTEEDAAYVARCRAIAAQASLRERVRFLGALPNDSVRSTFADHDLFPFPTSTENFGHVIAESLSSSCPVMIADTTPWTPRIAAGGGYPVDGLEVDRWRNALASYLGEPPESRMAARERAADAFGAWRGAEEQPHVFDMVRSLLSR